MAPVPNTDDSSRSPVGRTPNATPPPHWVRLGDVPTKWLPQLLERLCPALLSAMESVLGEMHWAISRGKIDHCLRDTPSGPFDPRAYVFAGNEDDPIVVVKSPDIWDMANWERGEVMWLDPPQWCPIEIRFDSLRMWLRDYTVVWQAQHPQAPVAADGVQRRPSTDPPANVRRGKPRSSRNSLMPKAVGEIKGWLRENRSNRKGQRELLIHLQGKDQEAQRSGERPETTRFLARTGRPVEEWPSESSLRRAIKKFWPKDRPIK
jgi:hypothetical protein